uniref:Death domain-containing protein n=1 Tax=Amphimedon queenslandica TaxID=400682 RepID=A0A1X7T5A0_AMPQE
ENEKLKEINGILQEQLALFQSQKEKRSLVEDIDLEDGVSYLEENEVTDLAGVLQLLRRYGYSGTSYYDLGLYLGLSSATLDAINTENERNVLECLRECLTKWLQRADNVEKKSGPTIYSLVSALRELGENGVADEIYIQLNACLTLDRYIAHESLTKLLPQLVVILYSNGIIEKIKLPPNDPQVTIIRALQKAVAADHHNLKKFASVLREHDAADIAKSIEGDYFASTSLLTEAAGNSSSYL